MYGKIQVLDTKDIRTILPITGLEKLNLTFHTPGLEGPNGSASNGGHPFHITRIENVAPDIKSGKNVQAYDIYFSSREVMFNQIRKVSKAYDGQVELAVELFVSQPMLITACTVVRPYPALVPSAIL